MFFFFCSMVKLEARPEDVRSSSLGDLFPACPLGNPSQLEPVTHLTPEPIQPHPWFLRKSHPRGFVLGEAFVPPLPRCVRASKHSESSRAGSARGLAGLADVWERAWGQELCGEDLHPHLCPPYQEQPLLLNEGCRSEG